ncbi:MAG: pirin family protein [Nocardioidaceae bacterium]
MLEIRRADDRFVTDHGDGVVSRHSFSFGVHYDPGNIGFGQLVCHNDDTLQPHAGYPDHPHRDLEIVTWVLEGELHHRDSAGASGVVRAGQAQHVSAGSGVLHQEYAGDGVTRFVQMWVRPDEPGLAPSYAQADVPEGEGWVPIAGDTDALLRTRSSRAALRAARLLPGDEAVLESAPFVHVYVCAGRVTLPDGQALDAGDVVRVVDDGLTLTGEGQLLAWVMR